MTIKQSPADFAVEELLASSMREAVLREPAAFALYRLTKEGLTTPAACAAAAKALGVRPGLAAYAGLKDRHARTIQHITVRLDAKAATAPESAEGTGWRIDRLGWLDAPITAEAIEANRFRITVRGLTPQACKEMDRAAGMLRGPEAGGNNPTLPRRAQVLMFVNYFGEQRFGSARHGRGFLARHLVRGEFEEALRLAIAVWDRKDSRRDKEFKRAVAAAWGRWQEMLPTLPPCPERRAVEHLADHAGDFCGAFAALPYDDQEMAVHAYQSYLWNETARLLLEEACGGAAGGVRRKGKFGDLFFPPAAAVSLKLLDLMVPLIGQGSVLSGPWKTAAEAVLAREGLTVAMLRVPGLRRPWFGEVPRRLFATAGNFSTADAAPDVRVLEFDLPRGAYATVLLRALGQ